MTQKLSSLCDDAVQQKGFVNFTINVVNLFTLMRMSRTSKMRRTASLRSTRKKMKRRTTTSKRSRRRATCRSATTEIKS